MAPELLLKRPYLPGPTDIWALGVVLYVFVCGNFPFKAQTKKDIWRKIKSQEINYPNFLSSEVIELL